MLSALPVLIILGLTLLPATGCDRPDTSRNGGEMDTIDGRVRLDSVGNRLQEGARTIGEKLDTAMSGLKTNMDEAQIQMALHQIKGMDSIRVDLSRDGNVTLSGSVPTESKRMDAERIVQEIKGVSGVNNQLHVGIPDSIIADTTLGTGKER
jgi:osmotically-inducible protein OsmY